MTVNEKSPIQIPTPINPDTEDMVRRITGGYETVKGHLTYLESEFERLVRSELIEPLAGHRLARDCRGMQHTLKSNTVDSVHFHGDPHYIADRAKYVCAILIYELAQMQYQIGELATLGRLDPKEHYGLQWGFFNSDGIRYTLWADIAEATVESVDYGGVDFYLNYYSDGRMIVTKIDLGLSRQLVNAIWPNDHDMLCGDGPISEWNRGIIAHIEPPESPRSLNEWYRTRDIKIDISQVLEGYAAKTATLSNYRLMPKDPK